MLFQEKVVYDKIYRLGKTILERVQNERCMSYPNESVVPLRVMAVLNRWIQNSLIRENIEPRKSTKHTEKAIGLRQLIGKYRNHPPRRVLTHDPLCRG